MKAPQTKIEIVPEPLLRSPVFTKSRASGYEIEGYVFWDEPTGQTSAHEAQPWHMLASIV
jgi:hypothetical protein